MPTIEISDIFDESLIAAGLRYGGVTLVARAVSRFIDWKVAGSPLPCPFSADKLSGTRDDGTIFQRFRTLNLRHCHFDLRRADPMIVYREFNGGDRILLLCVTDHPEMFGNEKGFWHKVKGLTRGRHL